MNKRKIFALCAALLCGLLMLGGGVSAMSSGSYAVEWAVIGGGGEPASSANYAIGGTIGQLAAESSFSTSYGLWSGYWYPAGVPGPAVTWDLQWGLDVDPAAVNIWTYSGDAVAVTLADVEWSMPSGLLIWYYGGPIDGWRFYKKGWGAVNTLETLIPGQGYIGIVPTASVWEIPQGVAG